jgi:hypothetical protein
MKPKGRRFETVSNIQRESQAAPDDIKEITSTVLLKRGKNDNIAVYVPKKSILKEMAAKMEYLSQHFFFDLVRELSYKTSYTDTQTDRRYS